MKKKIVGVMCAGVMATLLLTGCGSSHDSVRDSVTQEQAENESEEATKDESEKEPEAVKDEVPAARETAEEIASKLDIDVQPTLDGQIAVFITNNSNTVIDELEVKVNYIDESGTTIDQDSDGHDMILPGHTVVSRMEAFNVKFSSVNVEYHIELNKYNTYTNHADELELKSNPGDDCIIVEVTNNASESLDEIELAAALYKDDKVVVLSFPMEIYNLGAGESTTMKIDVYPTKTFGTYVYGTDYDRYEVFVNQAHTFGF